jgi:hypothetical protein
MDEAAAAQVAHHILGDERATLEETEHLDAEDTDPDD